MVDGEPSITSLPPLGSTINDFIDPLVYILNYCTVEDGIVVHMLINNTLASGLKSPLNDF